MDRARAGSVRGWALAPFAGIFIALLFFYWKIFTAQGAWLVGDHAEQHFPWQWYLAKFVKQGSLPFWTDLIHSGFPLIAEGQIGAFYLPNLFFAYLFPIEQGYAWNTVFHLSLSVFFMTVYLRTLGLDNRGIFIGTFVYAFGSTLGGAYYNITCLKVMTWFPLALILSGNLVRGVRPTLNALALGIIFSLQILAGYLQFAVYAMLFAGIYTFVRWWQLETGRGIAFVRLALGLGFATVLAAVLAFPQLMLTQELAFLSNRAHTSEDFAYVGSYSPFTVACLLFPNFEGFFVSKLYLGVLPLFFIFASFSGHRTRAWQAAAVIAFIALLLALGRYSPLYILLVKLLNFHSFRTPVKFIFFTGFFLSVLCAFGAEKVFNGKEKTDLRRSASAYLIFLMIALAGVIAAYAAFIYLRQPLETIGEALLTRFVHGKPGHPFAWPHYQQRLAGFIDYGRMVLDPRQPSVYIPFGKMLLAAIFVISAIKSAGRRLILFCAAVFILVVDLQLSYSDIRGDYASYETFYRENAATQFLKQNAGAEQYFNYSENPSEAPLPQAKNMIYGLRTANAYSPLILKDYYDFFRPLGGVNDSIAYLPPNDSFMPGRLKLIGMLGIRYVVTDRSIDNPGLEPALTSGKWRILKNTAQGTRYRLVENYSVIADKAKALEAAQGREFNPDIIVILAAKPVFTPASTPAGEPYIKTLQNGEGRLEFEVNTPYDSIFVLGQTYYPGWKAAIDGQSVEILRANLIMQAIPVPAGIHRLHFWYDPWHRLNNNRLWRILARR